ncbi:MAG: hypothetical protein U0Y82_05505 [Thermoleophilia bacterium]
MAAGLLAELEPAGPTEPVFPGLTTALANREFRAALRRAGVASPDAHELYDLRHTYASISIIQGVRPVTLAKRMGNSVPVAMNTYVRFWETLSPDADVVISGLLSGARRGRVGDSSDAHIPAQWKTPANMSGDRVRTGDIQLEG